ncbi:MAG TPA: polysaccharide biosynthesis/export family protein [Gemmatimonadaceae bacterium]|nr:polysaccharide biosynthesis/export family protein [Gemmatimonadaceae bacterium]
MTRLLMHEARRGRALVRAACVAATMLPSLAVAQDGAVMSEGAAELVRAAAPAGAELALIPGDVVRITVWRKPELSGEFVVGPDGSIGHPMFRTVRVTGVPPSAIEGLVYTHLKSLETNPQLVVEPLIRIAIGGEVRTPNLYTVRPGTAVALAVAQAGGTAERGRSDRVLILRGGRELTADLTKPDGLALPLQSGDQIVVPRRRSLFREVVVPVIGVLGSAAAIANYIVNISDR